MGARTFLFEDEREFIVALVVEVYGYTFKMELAMSTEIKSLVLDTWAGRRYYVVELVGQTPKKWRVRVLTPGGVMLPGRRYVNCGETVLVPKHAVVDLPKDTRNINPC